MFSVRFLLFLALLPLAAGIVFTHRITPALSARTSKLLRPGVVDASDKRGEANVTVEYQQGAYEWYLIDIQLGTPCKSALGGVKATELQSRRLTPKGSFPENQQNSWFSRTAHSSLNIRLSRATKAMQVILFQQGTG